MKMSDLERRVCTTEARFTVKQPQVAAGFTPMMGLIPVWIALSTHLSSRSVRWILLVFFLGLLVFGIVGMIYAARKRYIFVIGPDIISVGKTQFSSGEITSIRVHRRIVRVLTRRFVRQAQVTFAEEDVAEARRHLESFARRHGIEMDWK
jgi:hypothetical protein